MVIIKNQVKAYILLESLVALGVLVTIASLVLGQLTSNQEALEREIREQEVLTVATMAVQAGLDSLAIDGIWVEVETSDTAITVYESGRVVMALVQD